MSLTATTPPLHVLRGLLRRLRTPPLAPDLTKRQQQFVEHHRISPTATYVLEQYRANVNSTDPLVKQKLRKMAVDAARLADALSERKKLYAMDAGAEEQLTGTELTRRAAARAGLLPPDMDEGYEQLEKSGSGGGGAK
jgi:hypothetical protein